MTLWSLLAANLSAALLLMILAWLVHLFAGKASVADAFWGPGFAVIAWLSLVLGQGDPGRKILITLLVTVWAVRLAVHITRRSLGKPEDRRYAAMRARHPQGFWLRSLPLVFLLQGALIWVVSLPVQLGIHKPGPGVFTWLDWLALLLWGLGFAFEVLGDEQLRRFKADPANQGKTLDLGLWAYTRHPNYFGETLMWWALFLMAVQVRGGLWSGVGPLLLTMLLLKVSGVKLTEKSMEQTHADLASYRRRVSPFFPWPPKQQSSSPRAKV